MSVTAPGQLALRATTEREAEARRRTAVARSGPSPVVLKFAMALSGVVLFGFVFIHMIGNLKIYLGAEALDHYAEWLLEALYPVLPRQALLWAMRLGLLAAVVIHMGAAALLTRRNRAAVGSTRSASGARRRRPGSYTARTMPVTGVALALFIVFHILDLTTGTANPEFVRGDVHANIVASFERPLVALVYLAAMLLLGSHLVHGLWSAFTTLGVLSGRVRSSARAVATVAAGLIVVGNASIPIAVQLGLIS